MAELSEAEVATLAVAKGCCGDDKWRGHLCSYHDGYLDGYDAAIERVKAAMDTRKVSENAAPSQNGPTLSDVPQSGPALYAEWAARQGRAQWPESRVT